MHMTVAQGTTGDASQAVCADTWLIPDQCVDVTVQTLSQTLCVRFTHEASGSASCERPVKLEPTDPFDLYDALQPCDAVSAADAPAAGRMVLRYQQDPRGYWVHLGLPPVARLAGYLERLDPLADALAGFQFLLPYAQLPALSDPTLFNAATAAVLEQAALLPFPTSDPFLILVRAIRIATGLADALRFAPGDPEAAAAAASATEEEILGNLFDVVLSALAALELPAEPKACKNGSQPLLVPFPPLPFGCPSGCDLSVILDEGKHKLPDPPIPETANVPWDKITGVLWTVDHNPSCVGQSYGPCLLKLGELEGNATCKAWDDLGKEFGTEKGGSGSTKPKIVAAMKNRGYECKTAYDGLFESACEEAKAALDRGCDVIYHWPTHAEMVTGIAVDANDDEKCVVSTSSWGTPATVEYKGGKSYKKSDKSSYGSPDKNFPEGGSASIIYYCKTE